MLNGKKILIGITGSIAAYKSLLLIRLLIQEGAEVKVLMTPAAKDFVTPLSVSTLSKNDVIVDLFNSDSWANHVELGRWADIMIIAPLSCNTLAKIASGICDSLLMATVLSLTCPLIVAPAMDEDMWKHPATQRNLALIAADGINVINVEDGELASGLFGMGRMAEPETILKEINNYFLQSSQFRGKNVLVTAGPTYEAIDPVRFIGNHSSGKMGFALAEIFAAKGAQVTVVAGPVSVPYNKENINVVSVNTANEMYTACHRFFATADITVMAAAVADYTPSLVAKEKIKKTDGELILKLVKTKDILLSLGQIKTEKQVLVGFALETTNETNFALKKLHDKNADMIVLNSMREKGAGFGHDTNAVTIFHSNGKMLKTGTRHKLEVAEAIVEFIRMEHYV